MIVHVATITNAVRGMKKLLNKKASFSTRSLLCLKMSPNTVVFLIGENLWPSLLTTYTGALLKVKMKKMAATQIAVLFGVRIVLT